MKKIDEIVEYNYAPGYSLVHFVGDGRFNSLVRNSDLVCTHLREKREPKQKKVEINLYEIHLHL